MNISIEDLKAFRLAAEKLNFTQAAKILYMTQPAFSRLITSLEKEWGVRLFDRTTRKVSLTAEGKTCLFRVNQILDSYNLLLSDIERVHHQYFTELYVGFNPVSGPPQFFIDALKQLQIEQPGIKISLTRGYSDELVAQLNTGQLDCALVSGYYISRSDKLERKPLQSISLYALFHKSHPLAKKKKINLTNLSKYPLVFTSAKAPRTYQTVLSEFRLQELPAPYTISVDDLEELLMQVRLNQVVGISSFNDPNHQYDDIQSCVITEFLGTYDQEGRVLAWHTNSTNPCISLLCKVLDEKAQQHKGSGLYPFD